MNALQNMLGDYLVMRRGLGFKLEEHERCLREFLLFMQRRRYKILTTRIAVEWATCPSPSSRNYRAERLGAVRAFARYLRGFQPRTEVPPLRLIGGNVRPKPHIYTGEELRKLMAAAKPLSSEPSILPWSYYCLFGLLPVTGLRIGEALGLKREDVDLEQGVLYIHGAKFGKARLIPLHHTTRGILAGYAERRDALFRIPQSDYFLVAARGGRLWPARVHLTFYKLSRQIGLRGHTASTGPRLHDFRHYLPSLTMSGRGCKDARAARKFPIGSSASVLNDPT